MKRIIAFCDNCGQTQGIFKTYDELELAIAKQVKCKNEQCITPFQMLSDGRIWNLKTRIVDDKDATDDFWDDVHESITNVSQALFDNKHYADSVLAAYRQIEERVKKITKIAIGRELTGKPLMQTTFSVNNPIIPLDDDLTSDEGKNIQEGYMHIYAGAMQGIRNPKAHRNIVIDKKRATHFIFLASLLMEKLDERGV